MSYKHSSQIEQDEHYDGGSLKAKNTVLSDSSIDAAPLISHARDVIYSTYGHVVSVEQKAKDLFKFGRHPTLTSGTKATIWFTGKYQANETYAALNTNPIQAISSSSTLDVGPVGIEGHIEVEGDKTFYANTTVAFLNCQSLVSLPTGLNRLTRMFNSGPTVFSGEVYGYQPTAITEGKPDDTTKIHITVDGANDHNQSEKASTSLSSTDYWIVTTFRASIIDKTSATADVELQVRNKGGVFREIEDVTASNASPGVIKFDPYFIIPPNSDVRLKGLSSAAGGVQVSGSIFGYLAKII